MVVKVISLLRSRDRRQAFGEVNGHLDYVFFDAVDGAALDEKIIRESGIFSQGLSYSPGAYGCAMSHLALWDQCLRTGKPITIAEDDAVFRHDFEVEHGRVLNGLPEDWDFVLWGWNFDFHLQLRFMPGVSAATMRFDQEQLRRNLTRFQRQTDPSVALRFERVWGIPAYSISPKGAETFRRYCVPLRPLQVGLAFFEGQLGNTGIDSQMNLAYADTLSYAAFPPLVVTPNVHASSTIQTASGEATRKNWLSAQARKLRLLLRG